MLIYSSLFMAAGTSVVVGAVMINSALQRLETRAMGTIGRITIDGIISSLDGPNKLTLTGQKMLSADQIKQAIYRAQQNGVKGLMFHINCPGGAIAACRDISEHVANLKIPTVACIRELGASGGYMLASACDHIVSHEESLVGNIGAIMSSFDISGLLDKLGVKYNAELKSAPYKDIGNPCREMTKDEVAIQKENIKDVHDFFVDFVARNREMSKEKVHELANGLAYRGKKAKEVGLVDEIGGPNEAVEYLKRETNCPNPKLIDYIELKNIGILRGLFSRLSYSMGKSFTTGMIDGLRQMDVQ